jgi:hypothetical protein
MQKHHQQLNELLSSLLTVAQRHQVQLREHWRVQSAFSWAWRSCLKSLQREGGEGASFAVPFLLQQLLGALRRELLRLRLPLGARVMQLEPLMEKKPQKQQQQQRTQMEPLMRKKPQKQQQLLLLPLKMLPLLLLLPLPQMQW